MSMGTIRSKRRTIHAAVVLSVAVASIGLAQAQPSPTESSEQEPSAPKRSDRVLASVVPVEGSERRVDLERRINGGRPIGARLTSAQLERGDLLVVVGDSVIVSRRIDRRFQRYWLAGEVDRETYGLIKEDNGYRKITER